MGGSGDSAGERGAEEEARGVRGSAGERAGGVVRAPRRGPFPRGADANVCGFDCGRVAADDAELFAGVDGAKGVAWGTVGEVVRCSGGMGGGLVIVSFFPEVVV